MAFTSTTIPTHGLWAGLADMRIFRRTRVLTITILLAIACTGGCAPLTQPNLPIQALQQTQNQSPTPQNTDTPPVPTPSAVPTERPQPTRIIPTPTETRAPQPTATRAEILRLTTGGCCTQPFFSPDSAHVLFLDRPSEDAPSGLWGVPLEGGEPSFVTDRLGVYSSDMQFRAFPQGSGVVVERISDGQRWNIANGGRAVTFSPDGERIAWTAGQNGPPYDTAQRKVWISAVDGTGAVDVVTVYGGGFLEWFPDGRILVSGRMSPDEEGVAYWVVDPQSGEARELVRAKRLRGARLSPGGAWLAYMVAFTEDIDENGLWVVHTETGQRSRVIQFGAYQWRDNERLLVVPLDTTETFHRLVEVDVSDSEEGNAPSRLLISPAETRMKIAAGDWRVSPDGQHAVFVSAQDNNIWLIRLP